MNENLIRYLAAVVIKSGGDVLLTREELNEPVDIQMEAVEDEDGNSTGLRITAAVGELDTADEVTP